MEHRDIARDWWMGEEKWRENNNFPVELTTKDLIEACPDGPLSIEDVVSDIRAFLEDFEAFSSLGKLRDRNFAYFMESDLQVLGWIEQQKQVRLLFMKVLEMRRLGVKRSTRRLLKDLEAEAMERNVREVEKPVVPSQDDLALTPSFRNPFEQKEKDQLPFERKEREPSSTFDTEGVQGHDISAFRKGSQDVQKPEVDPDEETQWTGTPSTTQEYADHLEALERDSAAQQAEAEAFMNQMREIGRIGNSPGRQYSTDSDRIPAEVVEAERTRRALQERAKKARQEQIIERVRNRKPPQTGRVSRKSLDGMFDKARNLRNRKSS